MKNCLIVILLLLFLACNSISFAQTEKELFENGLFLLKKGMYSQAIEHFSNLINKNPKNSAFYKNRGFAYLKEKKYDLAIKDFESARSISPDLKDLYSNIGVAWYYKGNCDKAIENYSIAIRKSPAKPLIYFNRAICLIEQDKLLLAQDDLNKTLALQKNFYWALCLKADLLVQTGKPVQAIELYQRALQLNPDETYAAQKLEQLKQNSGNKKNITEPALEHDMKKADSFSTQPLAKKEATYTLQAGVFKFQSNAERRHKLLLENGYDSRIITLTGKKNTLYYSVRIGSFEKKEDANALKAVLKEKMKIDSIIRKKGIW